MSLLRSSLVVGAAASFSRVLGFVRDRPHRPDPRRRGGGGCLSRRLSPAEPDPPSAQRRRSQPGFGARPRAPARRRGGVVCRRSARRAVALPRRPHRLRRGDGGFRGAAPGAGPRRRSADPGARRALHPPRLSPRRRGGVDLLCRGGPQSQPPLRRDGARAPPRQRHPRRCAPAPRRHGLARGTAGGLARRRCRALRASCSSPSSRSPCADGTRRFA